MCGGVGAMKTDTIMAATKPMPVMEPSRSHCRSDMRSLLCRGAVPEGRSSRLPRRPPLTRSAHALCPDGLKQPGWSESGTWSSRQQPNYGFIKFVDPEMPAGRDAVPTPQWGGEFGKTNTE